MHLSHFVPIRLIKSLIITLYCSYPEFLMGYLIFGRNFFFSRDVYLILLKEGLKFLSIREDQLVGLNAH